MLACSIFEKQGKDSHIVKCVLSMGQTSTNDTAIFEQLAPSEVVLGANYPMSGTRHLQHGCSCELEEEAP